MTLMLIVLTACGSDGGDGSSDGGDETPTASGSWYVTGFAWPHDGDPYESENVIVYSDAASREARQYLAETGERILAELQEQFELPDTAMFRFPSGQTTIHIFAYKNHFPQEWGGQAYLGGLMIYAPDHPERTAIGDTTMHVYEAVLKHELVHVVQNLIVGVVDPSLMDVWCMEGVAETLSDSNPNRSVQTVERLQELMTMYGALNPIAMKLYEYPDIEDVISLYYYPMFQLAAGYLIDEHGLGRSSREIVNIFFDVSDGMAFETAFEIHFEINLREYEAQFFELMTRYLETRTQ